MPNFIQPTRDLIKSMTILLILLLSFPAFASLSQQQAVESVTIIMPSYRLKSLPGGDWAVDRDDRKEAVSFSKASINPYTSSFMQVIKKVMGKRELDLNEAKLAESFFRDEEEKIDKQLVQRESYDLRDVRKGTTTIGGKKLHFMSYKAVRAPVRVDALVYLYLPENYKEIRAFYVFFISEAYLEGSYASDLTTINLLITGFEASDHFVPPKATIEDLLKAINADDISRTKNLLNEGLDVNGMNEHGWSALMVAASKGSMEMLKLLIENGAALDVKNHQGGQTALIFAAHWGHTEVVRYLIAKGANLNVQMDDGWTALIDSISRGNLEVAKILIESGADTNVKSNTGWTALMAAAYENHPDIVDLLIKHGVDVKSTNANNDTALNIAIRKGHQEIVNLLEEQEAKK
jgi:hypothetical protein